MKGKGKSKARARGGDHREVLFQQIQSKNDWNSSVVDPPGPRALHLSTITKIELFQMDDEFNRYESSVEIQ